MVAPLIQPYMGPIIKAGQSVSEPLDLTGINVLLRVWMPAQWDDAELTFQLSYDGIIPYRDLFDVDGFELVRKVIPGAIQVIDPLWGRCLPFVKFRSGTRSKPVIQTADRTFTCICEK